MGFFVINIGITSSKSLLGFLTSLPDLNQIYIFPFHKHPSF